MVRAEISPMFTAINYIQLQHGLWIAWINSQSIFQLDGALIMQMDHESCLERNFYLNAKIEPILLHTPFGLPRPCTQAERKRVFHCFYVYTFRLNHHGPTDQRMDGQGLL